MTTKKNCFHAVTVFWSSANNERYHRPSCESQCLRTPLTTANCFLCRAKFSSQVTGTRWTTSVIPSHVTVPGQHRRFDGALATLARCNLREEHHENPQSSPPNTGANRSCRNDQSRRPTFVKSFSHFRRYLSCLQEAVKFEGFGAASPVVMYTV